MTPSNSSLQLAGTEGGELVMTPINACLDFLHPSRLSRIAAQRRR